MQLVRIKAEWRNNASDNTVYTVIENNGDRLLIQPLNCDMFIVPVECVSDFMIEPVCNDGDN